MTEDLFIPKLGQTVDEVILINWLVEDGAKVDFGDPVLEVETDKAIFNVEANAKGYIHLGPHPMGGSVPVLTVVATIGKKEEAFSPVEQVSSLETDVQEPAEKQETTSPQPDQDIGKTTAQESRKVFASPRAKKLAQQKQVDLSLIKPTGGNGVRVIEQDVRDFLKEAPKATPLAAGLAEDVGLVLTGITGSGANGTITRSDVINVIREKLKTTTPVSRMPSPPIEDNIVSVKERIPLRSVRKLIFERMDRSVHTTARVTLVTDADTTDLVDRRERLKAEKSELWGFTPGFNELFGLLVARTLPEFPYMNARLSKDKKSFELLDEINLGIAVDTTRGLIVPVIRKADQINLKEFGGLFRQLVDRAQTGRLLPEDLEGGTFTITNLGNFDVDAFTPVINLPEAAILGFGRIRQQVVPYQGEIKVRKMVTLSLVFDHRLIDGAPAARFLQAIKHQIENPENIFEGIRD